MQKNREIKKIIGKLKHGIEIKALENIEIKAL